MHKNRLFYLFGAILLSASLVTACGKTETPTATTAPTATIDAIETTSATAEALETETTEETRTIVDMAGRSVVIPNEIQSIYSANPISAIYLYTSVPDKLEGWNYELNDIEKSIILEKYQSLPNFGMGDAVNYEAVIAANPSIAISATSINDGSIDDADKLSEKLDIPVIIIDSDMSKSPATYRFLGELFGEKEQMEKLAQYAEKTFEDIAKANIPEDKQVSVYYGNGEDSLETAPAGSNHAQIIEMVRAINVADLEVGDGSRIQISPEQLISWDPDVIVVNGEPKANLGGTTAAEALMNNPTFSELKAVKDKKVFGTPNAPFSWVDRPPGPNRIIGVRWLAKELYPEYFDYDLDEEVRTFFQLFYHVNLTENQLQKLYQG